MSQTGTPPRRRGAAPGSTTSLRTANQRRVLDHLRISAPQAVTQADLVRATGLATGTVSSIVRELAEAEVLSTVAGAGRRGTAVRLARGAGLVGGVDFGHSHVAVAVGDMTGRVLAETREPIDPRHSHEHGLERACALLDQVVERASARREEVRTVGLGLPAPLRDDVVTSATILPGWVGVDARDVAEKAFGSDCLVDNDANLAALAEHRQGRGRGHHTMVFLKVSSGVGAGLIIGDQVFHGSDGMAGEVGHLTIDDQGPMCRCGSRGCLEAYAGTGTTLALLAEQLPGAGIAEVVAAAKSGHSAAARVFEDAGLQLGWGLGALTNVVNPDLVVVGGDMALAGDLLLGPARMSMRRHVVAGATATPIVESSLGERASLVGAIVLAVEATDLLEPTG